MAKTNLPITRLNKWFSGSDFNFEVSIGREFIEGDGNFTVILYKVNRNMTESDDVYNEASVDGIRTFPPIELKVMPLMGDSENKAYNPNGTLRFSQDGQFTFGIYQEQLDELDTDIDYGDYIGYAVTETEIRYFSVADNGIKNFDNKHTIFGYKSAFRSILCSPIDKTEFNKI